MTTLGESRTLWTPWRHSLNLENKLQQRECALKCVILRQLVLFGAMSGNTDQKVYYKM